MTQDDKRLWVFAAIAALALLCAFCVGTSLFIHGYKIAHPGFKVEGRRP